MAANKSVTVLTPNGRRQLIKTSPNTTILQILEEVCQKHSFNPDEYDLKHYNTILDVNVIFRYANIANKACLEMVKCKTPRKVSNIIICIQEENGNRVSNEFSPNANIQKILNDLGIKYTESSVIIYAQREIYAKDFESTTLKCLGLGNGKALFRLIERDLKELNEQAHIYVPPKPKVSKTEHDEEPRYKPTSASNSLKNKVIDPISIIKAEKLNVDSAESKDVRSETKIKHEDANQICPNLIKKLKNESIPKEANQDNEVDQKNIEENIKEPEVEFLGERNALLFNQAGAKAVHEDDIPDNFFELTINDAKALLRDVKKMQTTLEDSPLLTTAQRELEKDKEKLYLMHKYPRTIIRVQFPNQFVLQGLFGSLETVQSIKDFVKTYLENSDSDFTLYTSPPRNNLIAEKRLFDLDLVPSAIVYYSGSSDLKPEIKCKITDPTAASMQAAKTRRATIRTDDTIMEVELQNNLEDQLDMIDAQPSTSTSVPMPKSGDKSHANAESQQSSQSQKTQVPKWFKMSTK